MAPRSLSHTTWVPINYSSFLGLQLFDSTESSTFPSPEARVAGRPGEAFLPTSLLLLLFPPLGHCARYFSVSPIMQNQPPELKNKNKNAKAVFQRCPQTGCRLLGCGFGPPQGHQRSSETSSAVLSQLSPATLPRGQRSGPGTLHPGRGEVGSELLRPQDRLGAGKKACPGRGT